MPPSCRLFSFCASVILACAPLLRAASQAVSVPRYTHPGAGQTVYFVLTDRFSNGNPANDTGGLGGGPEQNGFDPTRVGYFHGGDFAGLTAHLDYLKHLGMTAIWVTPPFVNQAVQNGSAAYHGYWVTDFLNVDPHLGTNGDFREFVRQAHARGLKVYMDIIVNHTADVIHYPGYQVAYRDTHDYPLRDAAGHALSERDFAYNGLGSTARPALSADRSFAYQPIVPPGKEHLKNPDWLNDVTVYHNRGNSTFRGESSIYGDFSGLDDVFTEQPRVVQGMIDIFTSWVRDYGIDGFRIDTARHVNAGFWQAFAPAIRAAAQAAGRPDFIQFAEVANDTMDVPLLSEFSTYMPLDATLDFGFFVAARNYVSKGGSAAALTDLFQRDDWYTDHDSNAYSSTTFIGNHDAGRFGYFLEQDNPGAPAAELLALERLGHGLLLLARGNPVVYYGDEQGMVGRGGGDMQAREDMFAAKAPDFRDAPLLGTTRTGADDKFDPTHPLYRFIAHLAALRQAHVALRTGAMLLRPGTDENIFAFSRIDRSERVEYLVALNNSRHDTRTTTVPTSQPPGAAFRLLFDSHTEAGADSSLTTDPAGRATITLAPLQFAVWQAVASLPAEANPPRVTLVNPTAGATLRPPTWTNDGHEFPGRPEIRAEVSGGDGFAEVTFLLQRASRPGQFEWLGTDDAPPYRIFWNPPPDLAPGDQLTFIATVNDLRGHTASDQVGGLHVVPPTDVAFGIKGATVPRLEPLPSLVRLEAGRSATLRVNATGTPPLTCQWMKDGARLPGATDAWLEVTAPGHYAVLVHNRAGTALSYEVEVTAATPPTAQP